MRLPWRKRARELARLRRLAAMRLIVRDCWGGTIIDMSVDELDLALRFGGYDVFASIDAGLGSRWDSNTDARVFSHAGIEVAIRREQ